MVIIPDFVAMADDLMFTIDQITWTTGLDNFTVTIIEEAQIRSTSFTFSPTSVVASTTLATAPTTPATSPTTLITRYPHLCYKGRQIDNTDLLGAIDQVAWPTCSDHLSYHNNDRHEERRRYDTATTVMTTR